MSYYLSSTVLFKGRRGWSGVPSNCSSWGERSDFIVTIILRSLISRSDISLYFVVVVVVVVVFTIRLYPCVSCGAIPVQHDKVSFQTM